MEKKFIINNHEELIYYLQNFGDTSDEYEEYDYGWAVAMFAACLDNLKRFSLPIEIEDFGDYLDEEQIDFMLKLADSLRKYREKNLNNNESVK